MTGIRADGQHETPGIGDVIDTNKSPWLATFVAWSGRDDIDTVTGATITTRAIIAAVRAALIETRDAPARRCTHVVSD